MKRDPLLPLRDKLDAEKLSGGPKHWRSVEHKAGEVDIEVEFPSGTGPLTAVQRRDVLKLAGATFALAGAAGCIRRPEDEIVPYTHQPEHIIPGIANTFATAMPRSEGGLGLVATAFEGRPTKLDGNELHPSSLGASDVWAQAEILKLYDPDRARAPLSGGKAVTWADWDTFAKTHFAKYAGNGGTGLAFLLEHDEAPTVERVLAAALARLPNSKVFRFDPLFPANTHAGAAMAFGAGARVHHDLTKAKTVVALDSNFLVEGPEHLRLAKQWGLGRKSKNIDEARGMNRLYAVEGALTATGASADHRVRLSSAQASAFLRAVVGELAKANPAVNAAWGGPAPAGTEKMVAAVAKDLLAGGLVLVGERQPAAVHALAHAVNAALGAVASGAMRVTAVPETLPAGTVADLKTALDGKAVETLVILDVNAAYTAPGALGLAESLKKAQTLVHAGVMPDETSKLATWHLPLAHFLESWDDVRGWDGTAAVVQPLILPLHGARSRVSLLAQVGGADKTDDRALVEETWATLGGKAWRQALHDGVVAGTAHADNAAAVLNADGVGAAVASLTPPALSKDAVEVIFSYGHVLDGRLSNVHWNQELPDSMSKLAWDNALMVSPALAKELGIASGVYKNRYAADVVTVSVNGASVDVPTFVLPALGAYTAVIQRGYGKSTGEVAAGVGVDVAAIVPVDGRVAWGAKLTKTGKSVDLCSTQDHFAVPDPMNELTFAQMSGSQGDERMLHLGSRAIYRKNTLKLYEEKPNFAHEGDIPANLVVAGTAPHQPLKPLQPTKAFDYEGQQWGMVIDLTSCIGCNACTVACNAENNIPSVGREQTLLGRELHWMRIDRYFTGDVDDADALHMPMACAHCENAPCEPVCPVAATVHDEEGLNSMAYNRCIGTRYCANNCPFKVRRFNYLDFTVTGNVYRDPHQAERHETLKLQRNPNVTVRYRGVMEKCSYCTQRIEEAKVAAKRRGEDRKQLKDGAVTPACAQSCPTDAITFGNINDPTSRVHALKKSDRNYEMLSELNIRPRTTYLARVKNTNPEVG